MNKLIILIAFVFFMPCLVFASDAAVDNSNWGIPLKPQNRQTSGEQEERVIDNEQNQAIYQNYGSEDSPAFLNSVNPPENEFEYDSGDGDYYDDSDPYEDE